MPMLVTWFLTAEGEVRDGWRWLTASPVHAILGLLAISLTWGGCEHHEANRWYAQTLSARAQVAALRAASDQAHAAQVALNARVAAQYQQQAETADADYHQALADAKSAADTYIATHRLRVAPSGLGASGSPTQANNTPVPAPVPADTVVVSSGDVQACTGATGYAIAVHNAAVQVIADGTAIAEVSHQ